MPPSFRNIAAEKRAKQRSLIPSEWQLADCPSVESAVSALEYIRNSDLLTPRELAITETNDINDILGKISTGEISSFETTTAFAKRAALAQQLTNCCTEIFFEEAFATAKQLDEYLSLHGKTVGPLHGLPVSVKDCIDVKGHDSTIGTCKYAETLYCFSANRLGWIGLANKPAVEDSTPTKTLRELGAVLYVKTNVPQSLMVNFEFNLSQRFLTLITIQMSDSNNHLFGQCVNPLNRSLISGGSSGGESSLVAASGSPLGIGTDIGGSIRIPAALCGLYGLSPTYSRHPYDRRG